MSQIKTIDSIAPDFPDYHFNFQPELTPDLDKIDGVFNQSILNEIVLWKVNRYAKFNSHTLELINSIKKSDKKIDIDTTRLVLENLLSIKGVKIAMASTILRFKNPKIYQIIDQRVYRFIYGVDMPKQYHSKKSKREYIERYLVYLDDLRRICDTYKLDFSESDRIFYCWDKELNKTKKIRN